VAQAEALHNAGPEVVDDDVGTLAELETDAPGLVLLEIQRDAALATVVREEVRAEALLALHADDASEIPEARRLHFDHMGAHIGEDERRLRPLLEDGEVQYANAVQRTHRQLLSTTGVSPA